MSARHRDVEAGNGKLRPEKRFVDFLPGGKDDLLEWIHQERRKVKASRLLVLVFLQILSERQGC